FDRSSRNGAVTDALSPNILPSPPIRNSTRLRSLSLPTGLNSSNLPSVLNSSCTTTWLGPVAVVRTFMPSSLARSLETATVSHRAKHGLGATSSTAKPAMLKAVLIARLLFKVARSEARRSVGHARRPRRQPLKRPPENLSTACMPQHFVRYETGRPSFHSPELELARRLGATNPHVCRAVVASACADGQRAAVGGEG